MSTLPAHARGKKKENHGFWRSLDLCLGFALPAGPRLSLIVLSLTHLTMDINDQPQRTELLLLVYLHGFKGDDETFIKFPVSETLLRCGLLSLRLPPLLLLYLVRRAGPSEPYRPRDRLFQH
jgi:hypothetical protein